MTTRESVQSDAGISLQLSLNEQLARAFVIKSDSPLEATNPKDRIYALLEISNDTETLMIHPEYEEEITYQQVYTKVARCLILQGQLDNLSFCKRNYAVNDRGEAISDPNLTTFGDCHEDKSLPSWTPDWTSHISRLLENNSGYNFYRASGYRELLIPTVIDQPSDLRQINIEAVFVGKIQKIGTTLRRKLKATDYLDGYEAKTFFTETEQFLRESSRYSQKEKEVAVWRIPIADK